MIMGMKENVQFFTKFIKKPLQNASVTPSSRYSSRAMISKIDFDKVDTIIELGPGTGCFTREILKKAKPGTKIILIEIDDFYVKLLKEKFNGKVIIEHRGAQELDEVLKKHQVEKVDLIISGLPFLPDEYKERMYNQIKLECDKGAIFRFFTYMPPVMKKVYKDFELKKVAFEVRNVPPLWVYGVN